jgi:hypothetical protein
MTEKKVKASTFYVHDRLHMSCGSRFPQWRLAREKHVFGAVLATQARNAETAAAHRDLFPFRPVAAVGSAAAARSLPRGPAEDFQLPF